MYAFPSEFMMPSEVIVKMKKIDGARVFLILLSLYNISLQGALDVEAEVDLSLESIDEKLEIQRANNTCKEYILAKKYMELDELREDDNKDIFFDKRYDITRYDIIDDMKLQRGQMGEDAFIQFLREYLTDTIKLKESETEKEISALITGKRLVDTGDYAMLSTGNGFKYYKRENNIWELDDTIAEEEWSEIFCNLQKKCLQINNECNNMDINKSIIEKELLREIVSHYDDKIEQTKGQIKQMLEENLVFYEKKLTALIELSMEENIKYDIEKLRIASTYEIQEQIISPHAYLRDLILAQADFPKKQQDIKKFISNFLSYR